MRTKDDPDKYPLVQYFLPKKNEPKRDPNERLRDWKEIYHEYSIEEVKLQSQRCLDCAYPTCLTDGCPIQNDIPGWLRLVAEGKFLEAARLSATTSNMGEICGRVCPQDNLCEGVCNIEQLWGAVHIGKIEKFLNDYAFKFYGGVPLPDPMPEPTPYKVACIGAGPASMAVADELAKRGHKVVIYDIYPKGGGTLTYGIPEFKLEKRFVEQRFEYYAKMGVEFIGNTKIGTDIPFQSLVDNYDAVFIGIGAVKGSSPGVEGEDLEGVYQATEFLSRANLPTDWLPEHWKEPLPPIAGDVCITFGGGDTSIDCIRSARRLGYKKSYLYYRRGPHEMPANKRELGSAIEEGVEVFYFHAPKRFIGENGRVKAVECYEMELGEPGPDGRRRPVKKEGSEIIVECDRVVLAIGYNNDADIPHEYPDLVADKWGVIRIDDRSGHTSVPNVFCGGDARRGADLVVTAVQDGRTASRGIMAYLKDKTPKHGAILTKDGFAATTA